MTDQVATLCLRDNYFQTQSLSVAGRVAPALLDAQHRFIQFLEKAGRLDRALEFLPADEVIAERRSKKLGLTAPERAVLLAYSKMWLSDAFVDSDLPEDEWIATALGRYFPQTLREAYAGVMPRHPLRREIIATHVVNSMVNRVGSTFVHRLMETTGARAPEIVRAYLLQREIFGYVALWQSIEALDNKVPDQIQSEMLIEAGRLTVRATSWFLRSRRLAEPMEQTIEQFQPGVETLHAELPRLLDAQARSQLDIHAVRWTQAGVPREIATRVAALDTLFAALDIVEVGRCDDAAGADGGGGVLRALVEARPRVAARSHRADSRRQPLADAREDLDARRSRGAAAHARRQRARGRCRRDEPAALVGKWETCESRRAGARVASARRAARRAGAGSRDALGRPAGAQEPRVRAALGVALAAAAAAALAQARAAYQQAAEEFERLRKTTTRRG